jgi:hypothetical protein
MAIKSGKLINEPRNKELHTLHPLPTLCILVPCLHGCVAMFNMFSKHPLQKKRDINPIYDNVFKNIHFKRK